LNFIFSVLLLNKHSVRWSVGINPHVN